MDVVLRGGPFDGRQMKVSPGVNEVRLINYQTMDWEVYRPAGPEQPTVMTYIGPATKVHYEAP